MNYIGGAAANGSMSGAAPTCAFLRAIFRHALRSGIPLTLALCRPERLKNQAGHMIPMSSVTIIAIIDHREHCMVPGTPCRDQPSYMYVTNLSR